MADHNDDSQGPAGWLGQRLRNLRSKLQRREIIGQPDIESRFTKTYELNYWGDAESRSGAGSTMDHTVNVRKMLPAVIEQFGIRSLFDAPCGDFNWMRTLRHQLPVDYIGGDIVRMLIDENQYSYQADTTRFIHFDITRDPFPAVDLWFCRNCLSYLSHDDIWRALENFARSSIPYVLLTTRINPGVSVNRDIETGDWRPTFLFDAPFFLPPDVLFRFDDYLPPDVGREMCLWTREQIVATLARAGKFINPDS